MRHGVGGNHQTIVPPGVLRLKTWAVIEAARESVADRKPELIFDDAMDIQIRDIRATIIRMEVIRIVDNAIHIFQCQRDASAAVIFEDRKINHVRAGRVSSFEN